MSRLKSLKLAVCAVLCMFQIGTVKSEILDGGFESGILGDPPNHWAGSAGSGGSASGPRFGENGIATSFAIIEIARDMLPTEGALLGFGRAGAETDVTNIPTQSNGASARLSHLFDANAGDIVTGDYFSFLSSTTTGGGNAFAEFSFGIYETIPATTIGDVPNFGSLISEFGGMHVENGTSFSDWTSINYTFLSSDQFYLLGKAFVEGTGASSNSIAYFGLDNFSIAPATVPEPTTLPLLGLGLGGLAFARKRLH